MAASHSKSFLQHCRTSRWLRALNIITWLLLAGPLIAGPVPIHTKPDSYPAWWFEWDVIKQKTQPPQSQPTWPGDYPPADDFAAANLGQLKQIATKAAAELNTRLPLGAGSAVNGLVAQWAAPPTNGVVRDDFAAVNLGQLKAVAKVFYDQLIAVHYISAYPWTNGNADDFAVANVGQLKYLFSFDLATDSDGDGLPDWWEFAAGLNPNDASDASQNTANQGLTNNGNPISNTTAYQQGTDAVTAGNADPQNPKPGPKNPLTTLPTVTYAAIDVSSAKTTEDVIGVAINDQCQVGFMYYSSDGSGVRTSVFKSDGSYDTDHDYPFSLTPNPSLTWYYHGDTATTSESSLFNTYNNFRSCNAYGAVAGDTAYHSVENAATTFSRVFQDDGTSRIEYWPDQGAFEPSRGQLGMWGTPYSLPMVYLNIGNNGLLAGPFMKQVDYPTPNSFVGLGSTGLFSIFDDYEPTVFSPAGDSAGLYLSDASNPPLVPRYSVCTGLQLESIDRLLPLAVNDTGWVLGDDQSATDRDNALSVFDGYSTTLLSQHLPDDYKSTIRFPRRSDGDYQAWINSNGDVIVSAECCAFAENIIGPKQWFPRTLLWRNAFKTQPNSPSTLSFADLPAGAGGNQFNAQAAFSAINYVPETDAEGNPLQDGSMRSVAALLLPVEMITINAFIPQNNVDPIWEFSHHLFHSPNNDIFEGDNRIAGGKSQWDENGSHRIQQKFNMVAWKAADSNGLQDNAYANDDDGLVNDEYLVDVGMTRVYDRPSSLDSSGNLTAAARADTHLNDADKKEAEGKAPKTSAWIDWSQSGWQGDRKLFITAHCRAGDPLIIGASTFGPLEYMFTITIDKTDPAHPIYSLVGNHKGFPAYEVYINHTRVYEHDPLVTGEGLGSLALPMNHPVSKTNQPLP